MTRELMTDDQVAPAVEAVVGACAGIRAVRLVGSRALGTPTTLSDWDFETEVSGLASTLHALPQAVDELEPLAKQWDRLSDEHCYMLLLRGPRKIDLIFGEPHRHEPPWLVTAETLRPVDDHFWDWTLWLASKRLAGKQELVRTHLDELAEHILGPMGIVEVPSSLEDATHLYLGARSRLEAEFGFTISTELQEEVLRGIAAAQ
jgi:hypothetical protein